MSISVRRYVFVDQCLVPGLFNAFLAGGLGWWANREIHEIPFWVWGANSVVLDFLLTACFLPSIVCLVVSPLVAYHMRKGKVDRAALDLLKSAWLPSRSVWTRSILAALLAIVASSPPLLLWWWLGPQTVSVATFIAAKMFFVAIMSGGITALIAWWAMLDTSRKLMPL